MFGGTHRTKKKITKILKFYDISWLGMNKPYKDLICEFLDSLYYYIYHGKIFMEVLLNRIFRFDLVEVLLGSSIWMIDLFNSRENYKASVIIMKMDFPCDWSYSCACTLYFIIDGIFVI